MHVFIVFFMCVCVCFHTALQERQESQLKSPRGAEVTDGSAAVIDGAVDSNGVQSHPDASGSVGTEDGEASHNDRLLQVSKRETKILFISEC